jgi:PKD repeat protein
MSSWGMGTRRSVAVSAAVVALMALTASVLATSSAGAQKVANPGSFSLNPSGGFVKIRSTVFDLTPRSSAECGDGIDNDNDSRTDLADAQCAAGPNGEPASTDNSELAQGYQAKVDVSLTGTIDGAGNVTVPANQVVFPPAYVPVLAPDGITYVVTATVIPTHAATGTLNPLTGDVQLRVRFRVGLTGFPMGVSLGSNCSIGTSTNPIDLNVLTTGTTTPPSPATPLTGAPYNATGQATLVNNTFSVPGATGCPMAYWFIFPIDLNVVINDQIGLPSGAGLNSAVIVGNTTPVFTRAIVPQITIVSGTSSGPAPLTVGLTASSSTVSKGPATYLWQFPDGTTATAANVTKTFSTVGDQIVKLTVTDADGDKASTQRTLTVTSGGTTSSTTTSTTTTSSTTTSTTTTTTPTTTTTTSTTTTSSTTTSTTTTTTPTTTTTTSTTTTTAPTTTTTTSTTTTSTTTTTLAPGSVADRASVQVSGSIDYTNAAIPSAGDVRVVRDGFGIVSVGGSLTQTGANGGWATLTVTAQRFWILPLWTGEVSLFDPNAGISLRAPITGSVLPAAGTNAASGQSSWFTFGDFPNLIRPFNLRWTVDDVR